MKQTLTLVDDTCLPSRVELYHGRCACALHDRRLFTGLLVGAAATAAFPVLAREGVEVGGNSKLAKLVSAEQIESAAQQQYLQLRQEASSKHTLAPPGHPQQQRLQAIADRLIPHTHEWNPRAKDWRWQVSLISSKELNAFCMPGGKIAFYQGILQTLQLSDAEVAMIMGHEMAHALREHARERMGKQTVTRIGANALSSLLGLGNLGDAALGLGTQLLTLKFGRQDESEADLVGMELAARAGYDPRAGVTLWQKMAEASKGAPPQFLSTHPSSDTRIQDIESNLGKVTGLYARAARPPRQFGPPPLRGTGG